MVADLRVLSMAARLSVAEFFSLYPPRLWLVAWAPRVVFQLAFFAWLAEFIGGPELLRFALVGNAVHIAAHAVLTFATASVVWEQFAGTVPLLVASPSNPLLVFSGRNLAMAANGVVSGVITLYLAAPLFGLRLTPEKAIVALLLVILVAASTYGFAVLLGSFALRLPELRNPLSNIAMLTLMAIGGVNIPVTALPEVAQLVANLLPLTHGLLALRLVLADAPLAAVLSQVGAEATVGAAYFLLAQLSIRFFLHQARQRGTLEFH